MKLGVKILKAEWNLLFHSPMAWVLLIIFILHASWIFISDLQESLEIKYMGYQTQNLTYNLLIGRNALFSQMIQSLFIYIPLLSMSIIVKDYEGGTDKLLYSSPIRIFDILFGKFGVLICFGGLFVVVLLFYFVLFLCIVEQPDTWAASLGILTFVLVLIFYSAWGILMSSLFSSNVLVLIFTFLGLAFFNYAHAINLTPQLNVVLDWFSLEHRNLQLLEGLFSSDIVVWYLGFSFLFLLLTYFHIYRKRFDIRLSVIICRIFSISFGLFLFIGLLHVKHFVYYWDATQNKRNSVTPFTEAVLQQIDVPVVLRTYVPIFEKRMLDVCPASPEWRRFVAPFIRSKRDITLEEVYYYDTIPASYFKGKRSILSDEEVLSNVCEINEIVKDKVVNIKDIPDFKPDIPGHIEQRLFYSDTAYVQLRFFDDVLLVPSEKEMLTAFKSIVDKSINLGFYAKNSFRCIDSLSASGYTDLLSSKRLRSALINQGFNIFNIKQNDNIDSLDLLLVVAPIREFSEDEQEELQKYIQSGKNMIIVADTNSIVFLNSILSDLGVAFDSGCIKEIENQNDDYLLAKISSTGADCSDVLQKIYKKNFSLAFTYGIPINSISEKSSFQTIPLAITADSLSLVSLLERDIKQKKQRVLLIGNADWMSNEELLKNRPGIKEANTPAIYELVRLLSNNSYPVIVSREQLVDKQLLMDVNDLIYLYIFISLCLLCIVGWGIFILKKRKVL